MGTSAETSRLSGTRPTLNIDLDAIVSNWRALDALSGKAETAAVVKANAYGTGAGPVVSALERSGCQSFFVATLDEAIELDWFRARGKAAITAIYILNGVDEVEAKEARERKLRPVLNAREQIAAWQKAGGGPCALQLDSGMSRLGLAPYELEDVPEALDTQLIMTHLACADEPDHPENEAQRRNFAHAIKQLPSRQRNARRSIAATGGTLLGEDYALDLVRCGIGLYGGLPFADAQPTLSLHSPILQIRDIPAGRGVGYGVSWRAERTSRIATLPLGYADGLHRALSNSGKVIVQGQFAPIAGRVSMDLITIDITGIEGVEIGSAVEIIGPNQGIDALASAAGTIGYELLTSLGGRYERRYSSVSDDKLRP